jgi:hypothetical protein
MTKGCIDEAETVVVEPRPLPVTPVAISEVLDNLRRDLHVSSGEVILGEAIALFRWAIKESRDGRVILSGDPQSGNMSRLRMPLLGEVFRTNDGR